MVDRPTMRSSAAIFASYSATRLAAAISSFEDPRSIGSAKVAAGSPTSRACGAPHGDRPSPHGYRHEAEA
jgi:hypothetical protein